MHISHTAEKNFKCRELCEETFRTCQFRLLHKRSCRGVKEFKCKICPKEFMQCVSLKFRMGNLGGRKEISAKLVEQPMWIQRGQEHIAEKINN